MSLELLKADLPNMPDEVIDIWLLTFFNRFGWPPKVNNDWRFILRPGNDLSYLQKLRWQKEMIKLSPNMLSPKDLSIVVDIYKAHVLGQQNLYSMMPDGRERFEKCCDYIKKNGVFPCPIILRKTDEGLWILDGNHRMTAYFYLYGYFETSNPEIPYLNVTDQQEVWMAA